MFGFYFPSGRLLPTNFPKITPQAIKEWEKGKIISKFTDLQQPMDFFSKVPNLFSFFFKRRSREYFTDNQRNLYPAWQKLSKVGYQNLNGLQRYHVWCCLYRLTTLSNLSGWLQMKISNSSLKVSIKASMHQEKALRKPATLGKRAVTTRIIYCTAFQQYLTFHNTYLRGTLNGMSFARALGDVTQILNSDWFNLRRLYSSRRGVSSH